MDSDDALRQVFGRADRDHLRWQTTSPGVSERERDLVEAAFLPLAGRVLDMGCGEGATLMHLGSPSGATGIDLFEDKVTVAKELLPRCEFVSGSVYQLPFKDNSFDQLIVRDLVHHLEEPGRFVEECARVLAKGGRIDVLEPCRYNPLILLHALTNRVERGELRSTPKYLVSKIQKQFRVVSVNRYQPFPVHRIVYHPSLGRPALAGTWVSHVVDVAELLAEKLAPRWAWAYIHVRSFSNK